MWGRGDESPDAQKAYGGSGKHPLADAAQKAEAARQATRDAQQETQNPDDPGWGGW